MRNERRPKVFGRMIEVTSGIGDKMGGRKIEAAGPAGMPLDGTLLYPGGQVTNEYVLGVIEEKRFEGQAASNALALNRMAAVPEPPLRRSDRSRSLDGRLRALGVRVAGRC